MNHLENFKMLIGEKEESDELLQYYLTDAESYILNYCDLQEVPNQLDTIMLNIAIFKYRLRGYEGVKRESMGAVSETLHESLPSFITEELDRYNINNRKVRFL
ncbi:head-tail connector protein [Bacillus subtilis]|uniref:head-tail connector protein n=1 Tax=Bacillus subtilis TaxID=1423 RepID=UPI0031F5CC1C